MIRQASPLVPASCSALVILLAVIALPGAAAAQGAAMNREIERLIDAVGRDGCVFLRNERRYPARDARAHLRSKWRRNAQLLASTEDFIEKLASRSATSGEPYVIRCRDSEWVAGEWFRDLLARQRLAESTE